MKFARRCTAVVRARLGRPAARPFAATETLETRTLFAAVVDDFNDGNDAGWTHYSPLGQFGAPGTYEVVDGAYHIFAPTSPAPDQAGPGRAGSFRDGTNFSDFIASVDIVDWDENLTDQAFGFLARTTSPGLGSTNGYALTYGTSGDLDISLVTGEAPDDLDPGLNVSLDPDTDYRLVFEGHGPTLTGRLINLTDGSIVAATRAVDSTYASGSIGLIVYDSSRNGDSTADATFDNFFADVAPPDPTVAYWRFEEGQIGIPFQPPTTEGGADSGLAPDSFGGDDPLRTFSDATNPTYSNDVGADTVAVTGEVNRRSMDFSPNEDLYTAQPGALTGHAFNQWTVEASFNVDSVDGIWQGIVSKDGKPTASELAPLQLKVRDDNDLLQIEIIDAAGNARQVSSLQPIVPGTWYNAAAVSDGSTLKLYLDDASDDAGYVLQGSVDVSGGLFPVNSNWAVGRGFFNGNPTDWTDGRIDEVRISAAAVAPSNFLFAGPGHGDPTQVTAVFVNGPGLTGGTPNPNQAAFRTMAGIDPAYGYPIPAGANQLKSIPWVAGVNQVAVRFNNDVAGQIDQGDLVVRGVNTPTYTPTSFSYDPATKTAVWTLPAAITNDKIRLVLDDSGVSGLDGEWQNAAAAESFPSGDGAEGGDFNFRFNVLGGDATQDGKVNALDLSFIKQRLNRSATNPGTGAATYSVFADLDANGQINALDLSAAKQRLNRTGPPEPETVATALLFGRKPISA